MAKVAAKPQNKKKAAIAKGSKPIKKNDKTRKVNWNRKKLDIGQYLSEVAYYRVEKILKDQVEVVSSLGNEITVDLDLLKQMDSAQHYAKEVHCNMTQLVEVLETVNDTIFKVVFKKQANVDAAAKRLESVTLNDLKNPAKKSAIAEEIAFGERSTMICKMIDLQTILGRSLVIDFSAASDSKFRQVDHRTIESIVLRNVLYTLKSGAKAVVADDKKDGPKWDYSKLKVGDWFSGTTYYKVTRFGPGSVDLQNQAGEDIYCTGDLPETEWHNSSVYDSEEHVSLTKVAEVLTQANTKCFTVSFNTKTDKETIAKQLTDVTQKDLNDTKALAKKLLTGKQTTIIGRLANSEGKLGRSLVIDLESNGYKQVDHRHLLWLVLDNVKYTVK